MPVWRLQTSFLADSALPRDRIVLTPHFDDQDLTTGADEMCQDLASGLATLIPWNGEIRVTAYDAQGTKPVFPQGEAVVNQGVVGDTARPRELSVCLSFYSQRNLPRQRGRMYIPAHFYGSSAPGIRPAQPSSFMSGFVTLLQELGGTEVDWCVYSRRDNVARPVTHWWYDNEWDVVRSRGLRGDTRVTGTTSEA